MDKIAKQQLNWHFVEASVHQRQVEQASDSGSIEKGTQDLLPKSRSSLDFRNWKTRSAHDVGLQQKAKRITLQKQLRDSVGPCEKEFVYYGR